MLLLDYAVRHTLHRTGEICPRQQGTEIKNWVGEAFGRNLDQASKKDSEHQHGGKGLNDCPGGANHCLLISDFDGAPYEEIDELARSP